MSPERTSLVTGASSGIGECFAHALAAEKYNLVLVARSKDKLQSLASQLHDRHGVRALPLDTDLSVPGAAAGLAERLRRESLSVSLLVNNAGFGGRGKFWELPLDRQVEMFRLNVQAVVELTHLLLPAMIERRIGGIINVSSLTSFQPVPYAAMYAATKAFLTQISMALAQELRPYGIPVVTLCPGGTRTNFFEIGQRAKTKFPGGPQAPEEVVALALRKLRKGGGLTVPGPVNQIILFSQRFLPRQLIPRLIAKYSEL